MPMPWHCQLLMALTHGGGGGGAISICHALKIIFGILGN